MAKPRKKKKPEVKEFTSADAKRLSARRATIDRDKKVNDIIEKIKVHSSTGEGTTMEHPLVSLAVSKKLQSLGFTLTFDALFSESSIIISW